MFMIFRGDRKSKSSNVDKGDPLLPLKAQSEITLQQLEDERKRLKELEHLLEQRNNIFNSLIHEIKIPLTLLNVSLKQHISKNGETDELRIIKENLFKVTKDVENFWDIEKLFKGFNFYNHNQSSNLSQIVIDTVQLFKQYAHVKNIKLVEIIEDKLSIKADPEALSKIVLNLVENALKYTDENGEVSITLYREGYDIVLNVKDTGVGIPVELQELILAPSFQYRNKQRNDGLGLGLAIVKRILDSLDGKIKLVSNPLIKRGTEVSIILSKYHLESNVYSSTYSIDNASSLSTSKLEAKDEITNERNTTILLIIKNVDFINYLHKNLRKKYNLVIALSEKEALEKFNSIRKFDLILADVSSENDGEFEFYKRIAFKHNHIPMFFLISNTTKEDKLRGLSSGAVDCIEKPIFIDVLVSKIESFLKSLENHRIKIVDSIVDSALQIKGSRLLELEPVVTESFEHKCKNFNLTKREIEVVILLIKGKAHKEIAGSLNIDVKTVSRHSSNIFLKTGVNKNTELVNVLGYPKE